MTACSEEIMCDKEIEKAYVGMRARQIERERDRER